MKDLNWFEACGIVAWPLLAFSIVGLAMIAERMWFWFKVNRRQSRVVREAISLYQREPEAAIHRLKRNADLPICRIFLQALGLDRPNPDEFRIALESAAQAEVPVLKRFNVAFDTIIALAPLLGLLGTVLGLITTFASLSLGDIGGTKTAGVTAGISEALVSTATGLIVAMFTIMFANTFRGFYLQQMALIQEYGGQIELLYRRRYEIGDMSYAPTR